MKKIIFCLLAGLLSVNIFGFTPEMKSIKLKDGEKIEARLCLPDNEVKTIVLCVPGTGPSTWLDKRSTFNYFDELAEGFCEQGVAFFTYNRRGCEIGENPPWFVDVDSMKYAKYTPLQEAEDIEVIIASLLKDKRFKHSKIILYGISEGTIIAPLVAERKNVRVDALLLHGYSHDNMFDIVKWQNEGHGVMIMANSYFDQNGDKLISKEEYENQDEKVKAQRLRLFQNASFESLDIVKNGFIDIDDIRIMRVPFHEHLLKCITENNWYWIRNYYFNITPHWFKKHFELEPNKTRLLRIDIPVHVFHGTIDASVPVESVYDLQIRFEVCNKTNLTIHVFEKHNHDLNFVEWLTAKKWPEGFTEIFNVAKSI